MASSSWSSFVFLSVEAREELLTFWYNNFSLFEGKSFEIKENYTSIIYSDASRCSAAAFILDMSESEIMTKWEGRI